MAKRLSTYFGSEKPSLTDTSTLAPATRQLSPAGSSTDAHGAKTVTQKASLEVLRPHRFFNTATGVHFYTISDQEKREIERFLPQFRYEGRAYRVLTEASFAVPVYRFYNRVAGTHLYTASESERNTVIRELADIYSFEGAAWYARPGPYPGWVPVYRFFNRLTGTHFYTHDEAERANVLATLPHYALEGVAYWVRSEDTAVDPQIWQPPAGATPSEGNYVYFESQAGDFVGRGEQHLWTATNSRIQFTNYYSKVAYVSGEGTESVGAYFYFPSSFADWKPGFYPNATKEHWMLNSGIGLDFGMGGRGCNETTGWIYVDSVAHDPDGSLVGVELRFEQLCQWSTDVLRGKLRWSKHDTVMPPGPVVPAPLNLWRPPTGAVPDNGSFVYFEGYDPHTQDPSAPYSSLIRPSDSTTGKLGISAGANGIAVMVDETTNNGSLSFRLNPMWFLPQLVPGYYGGITRTPSSNPARGDLYFSYQTARLSWSCFWSVGWFVIDDVTYAAADVIDNFTLRFEQQCLGSDRVIRGMVRWQTGD